MKISSYENGDPISSDKPFSVAKFTVLGNKKEKSIGISSWFFARMMSNRIISNG